MYASEYFRFFPNMFSFLDEEDTQQKNISQQYIPSSTKMISSLLLEKPITCVFDLDNTLVCAVPNTELHTIPSIVQTKFKYYDFITTDTNYRIFIRPHFIEMINEISQFADIAIWTAATEDYAKFIIQHIFPSYVPIKYMLHRTHTEYCVQKYNKFKPLEYIYSVDPNSNQTNTIIIDDLIDVASSNPMNCIQIKPFKMITDYLKQYNTTAHTDLSLLYLPNQIKNKKKTIQ